jgi:hypothetical protein
MLSMREARRIQRSEKHTQDLRAKIHRLYQKVLGLETENKDLQCQLAMERRLETENKGLQHRVACLETEHAALKRVIRDREGMGMAEGVLEEVVGRQDYQVQSCMDWAEKDELRMWGRDVEAQTCGAVSGSIGDGR